MNFFRRQFVFYKWDDHRDTLMSLLQDVVIVLYVEIDKFCVLLNAFMSL